MKKVIKKKLHFSKGQLVFCSFNMKWGCFIKEEKDSYLVNFDKANTFEEAEEKAIKVSKTSLQRLS